LAFMDPGEAVNEWILGEIRPGDYG
jgi:hypothetical protein